MVRRTAARAVDQGPLAIAPETSHNGAKRFGRPMTNTNAGKLDRRVIVEFATETQDAAGDVTVTWAQAFKRWAIRVDGRGREFFGAQQMVRDADTVFEVRDDDRLYVLNAGGSGKPPTVSPGASTASFAYHARHVRII